VKRWPILLALIGLAALGCKIEKRGSYSTHLVLYHRAPEDQSILAQYDYIVCGPPGYFSMEEGHRQRALLYFNPWGADGYRWRESYPSWQPRPGDLGQPEAKLAGVWVYQWGPAHADSLSAWVERALEQYPAAGVFLDDWALRDWWVQSAADSAVAKAAWPFYPRREWLLTELKRSGLQVAAAVAHTVGTRGLVVVNGPWRYPPGVSRMSENAGCYRQAGCRETWANLSNPENDRHLEPGDFLQVNVLAGDGTIDQQGFDVLEQAAWLAANQGLSLGVAYYQRPPWGGSIYQVPTNSPWVTADDWPLYKPEP